MKSKVLTTLVVALTLAIAGSVCAQTVKTIYYDNGWQTASVPGVTGQYTDVAGGLNAWQRVYALKTTGGMDRPYGNGVGSTWGVNENISAGSYTDVTSDLYSAYAAKTGGGIDQVTYNGGWITTAIPSVSSSTVYSALANGDSNYRILASKATGGLDWIYFDNGAWGIAENVLPNSYVDMSRDPAPGMIWYGAKAGGGIDYLGHDGGWFATALPGITDVYTSVASEFQSGNRVLAAKASGGADWIWYADGEWHKADTGLTGTYLSLTADDQWGMTWYAVQENPVPQCTPDDIVLGDSNGNVTTVDKSTLETKVTKPGFGTVTAVGVQPNKNIVVANSEGKLSILNDLDLTEIASQTGLGNIRDLGIQSDGNIVIGTDAGSVTRRNGTDLSLMATAAANYGTITSMAILKGSDRGTDVTDRVAVGNAAGGMYLLDGTSLGGYAWGPDWGYVRGMAGTPNGNIAFGTDAGMFIRTGRDFDGVAAGYGFGSIYDVTVRPTGEVVLASDPYNGMVWMRRGTDLEPVASNPGVGTTMKALAVQSDGDIVIGRSDGYLIILDGNSVGLSGKITKSGFGQITAVAAVPAPPPVVPVFSPAGGTYVTPVSVAISYAVSGATIRYTTDGTEPTTESAVHTDPILVDATTTIKAKAWDGANVSPTASATYTIGVALNNPQTIPYVDSILVDGNLADWAGSEWVDLDKQYHTTSAWEFSDIWDFAAGRPHHAKFALKWGANGTKLYVAVEVVDKDFVFTPDYGSNYDASDRVEMQIHTSANSSDDYMTPGSVIAQQYTIGLTGTGALWKGIAGNVAVPGSANFQCAGRVDGEKLIYEAAMTAFESFGALNSQPNTADTLVAGDVIGADASVGSRTSDYGDYFQISENLMAPKYLKTSAIGRHLLVIGSTIENARKSGDGAAIASKGIVSAVFTDCFYIESTNRVSGIRVNLANHGRAVGQEVTASGILWTLASGERYIIAKSAVPTGSTGTVAPLGMNNKALGGSNAGTLPNGQCGVAGATGVNNIGILVKTTGKVGTKGTGWFKIDDGSGVSVKVFGTVPAGTPYVAVTGISSCEKDAGLIQRAILATDIMTIAP